MAWVTRRRVWANVQEISGREYLMAQQLGTALSHSVSMRYYPDIVPAWRILTSDGGILNIHSVANPDGMKREHLILCEQVIPSVD